MAKNPYKLINRRKKREIDPNQYNKEAIQTKGKDLVINMERNINSLSKKSRKKIKIKIKNIKKINTKIILINKITI